MHHALAKVMARGKESQTISWFMFNGKDRQERQVNVRNTASNVVGNPSMHR